MHYATIDNQIGSDNAPQGSIEITADQYKEALQHKLSGGLVTVEGGQMVLYNAPVYAPDGTERDERDPNEPLITFKPSDDLQIPEWDGNQWIESETDAQRQDRLEQEEQDQWDRICSKRDNLLSATDWTVLPDAPLTDAQVSEAKTYRQSLRDLPQTYDTPEQVEYPNAPSFIS